MEDVDKDIVFSTVTASILLALVTGTLYGTYRYGHYIERRDLTKAYLKSIPETYHDGYQDGYKLGFALGHKKGLKEFDSMSDDDGRY